jgi:hypothetical protein
VLGAAPAGAPPRSLHTAPAGGAGVGRVLVPRAGDELAPPPRAQAEPDTPTDEQQKRFHGGGYRLR